MTEATQTPPPPAPESDRLTLTLSAPPPLRCPRCGRADVACAPRQGALDRLVAVVFWRPLVCGGCGRRFRRFVSRAELARLRAPRADAHEIPP